MSDLIETNVMGIYKDHKTGLYYYVDEAEQLNGSYKSFVAVKKALDNYIKYLNTRG